MDKTFKIKIIRSSDSEKFSIGDDSDWKLLKKGLDGFGKIENNLSYTDNALGDGGHFTSEHIGKRDRTIKFTYIHADSNDVARKKLLSFFNVKDDFKVYITRGEDTYWALGKMYKMNVGLTADLGARLDVSITFLFANPYWNSFDDFGKNIASLIPMTGFPYVSVPAMGGTTGGIFNFAQQVTLYNDGDVDTYCKAIIQCKGGQTMKPELRINGEYVRVLDTMEDGDEIEMNFTAFPPTVKKNGVNFIGHCDRTSAFDGMILQRGDNLIEYDAENGSSHMNVTIYYYKQYGAV